MPRVSQRELRNLGIDINTTESNTMLNAGSGAAAAPIETFSLNTYACNINPGTDNGSKLYLKAIESVSSEKKIEVSIGNGHNVKSTLESYSSKCAWGLLLRRIADNDGVFRNVIKNYKHLTKENVLAHSNTYLENGLLAAPPTNRNVAALTLQTDKTHKDVFFKRVCSKMVA